MTSFPERPYLNGIDLRRLQQTIQIFRERPDLARFEFRVLNEWREGGFNVSRIQGFYGLGQEDSLRTAPFVVSNDEPDLLFGEDKAPNPVEWMLHALAGCITTVIAYCAAARRIHLRSLSTRFEGDLDMRGFLGLDPSVRKGLSEIRIHIHVDAPELSATEREELITSAIRNSPIFDSLTRGVNMKLLFDCDLPC